MIILKIQPINVFNSFYTSFLMISLSGCTFLFYILINKAFSIEKKAYKLLPIGYIEVLLCYVYDLLIFDKEFEFYSLIGGLLVIGSTYSIATAKEQV
jgi:drug/metabolite transporter (DMT)-like permease